MTEQQSKKIEEEEFKKLMKKWDTDSSTSTRSTIPKFYWRLPSENEPLRQRLHEEARSNFLQKKTQQLLDSNELGTLWVLLNQHKSDPDEQLLTYGDFQVVAAAAAPKIKPFFTSTLFARLQQGDPHGRVSIMSVFNYVMRKVWIQQTRVGLSLYDTSGQGYLQETDLEGYISELVPTLPQLEGLERSFHSFYVCTAVRKFLFFLDPLRAGRVRILDVLACSFLDELLELRDEELSKEVQEQNWFSAPSALRVSLF